MNDHNNNFVEAKCQRGHGSNQHAYVCTCLMCSQDMQECLRYDTNHASERGMGFGYWLVLYAVRATWSEVRLCTPHCTT